MKYLSNAKINLNLMITGIDNEGYHTLYSVVAPIDLYDELDIELNDTNSIVLECNKKEIPTNEKNIIIKCIHELRKYKNFNKGIKIKLKKNIPNEAGLGGGSSNGATTLLALNDMLKLNLTKEELVRIGVKVGADIPLFIYNKVALMEGRGEKITVINNNEFKPWVLLVKPDRGVSTKEAFSLFDKIMKTKEYTPLILHKLIEENNKEEIYRYIKNDLQRPALMLVKEIQDVLKDIENTNPQAFCMSGSGSCCFGLFEREQEVINAYNLLKNKYKFVKIAKIL